MQDKRIVFVEKCEEDEVRKVASAYGIVRNFKATIYNLEVKREDRVFYPCLIEPK